MGVARLFWFLAQVQSVRFDEENPSGVPSGWTTAITHEGARPKWAIVADESAPSKPNVLAQLSSQPARAQFPLALLEGVSLANGEIEVKFKPVSGEVDRAAGLVWRYRDENNYYIVRANALEDNVVLYKVAEGKRTSLAPRGTPSGTYGVDREVPAGRWSALKVVVEGPRFTVFFNGERLFEVEDGTFTRDGGVGLWTKADSVTYFDDFEVRPK
jgi:hypothetical protein